VSCTAARPREGGRARALALARVTRSALRQGTKPALGLRTFGRQAEDGACTERPGAKAVGDARQTDAPERAVLRVAASLVLYAQQ
jgi:hypothetical protein